MSDTSQAELAYIAERLEFDVKHMDGRVYVLWSWAGYVGAGETLEEAVSDLFKGLARPAIEKALSHPPLATERQQLRAALRELYHDHSAVLYSSTRDGERAREFEEAWREKYGNLLED